MMKHLPRVPLLLFLAAIFEFGHGCQPRPHKAGGSTEQHTENRGDGNHASDQGSYFVSGSGGGGYSQAVPGNGQLGSEERPVGPFTGVKIGGTVTLHLSQSMPIGAVRLEGETNILPLFDVSVQTNGILSIEPKPQSPGFVSRFPIKAYASSNTVDQLNAGGASKIFMSTALNGDSVRMTVDGASRIEIPSGRVESIDVDVRGASRVLAFGLQAESVRATAAGASVVELTALKSLAGSAAGASRILYRGSPQLGPIRQSDVSAITQSN